MATLTILFRNYDYSYGYIYKATLTFPDDPFPKETVSLNAYEKSATYVIPVGHRVEIDFGYMDANLFTSDPKGVLVEQEDYAHSLTLTPQEPVASVMVGTMI